jgi:outer membrane protein assembly factor BamB
LVCLSADTGKVLWSSANGSARNLAFYGPPLLSGSHLYAIGIDGGNDNNNGSGATGAYTLVSVALSDGAVQSRVALGTPQFGTDEYSGQRSSQPPALIELSGKVCVLTNNGAVLAVDPAAGHVDWAFTFAPKVESQDNYYYNFVAAPPALAPGAMLASGSTLFVKELGSSVLYALDLDGPALKWKRPVDEAGGLAALRGGDLVMVGPSVDVLDAETRDLRWSAPVSVATGDVQPAWAGNHVYTFGRRGVHDLVLDDGSDGGPVFRGADRDSSGGAVLRAGNRLVTVSRSAITAYPLAPPLASQPGAH